MDNVISTRTRDDISPGQRKRASRRGTRKNPESSGREADAMKNPGYVGKISNSGAQVVKAPNQEVKKGTGKVKTGTDLRAGKGK